MKREILGVKIDDIDKSEALAQVKDRLASGKKGYIVTPNPEIIMLAQADPSYKKVLNQAFLSLPDGIGVVLAGKILGESIKERLTGVDFTSGLAALCAEHGFNLFLLGAADNVSKKASEVLQKDFPGLNIAGTYSPDLIRENHEKIMKRLNEQEIDVLAVAFGPPKQEQWIAENLAKLKVKTAIGVGGTLDFIAGEKPRAPSWLRTLGLEWLFRLGNEPTRWKRQLSLPQFALRVFKEKFFPS